MSAFCWFKDGIALGQSKHLLHAVAREKDFLKVSGPALRLKISVPDDMLVRLLTTPTPAR